MGVLSVNFFYLIITYLCNTHILVSFCLMNLEIFLLDFQDGMGQPFLMMKKSMMIFIHNYHKALSITDNNAADFDLTKRFHIFPSRQAMGYLLVIFWRKWDILSDVSWLFVVAVNLVSSHSYQIFGNSRGPLVMCWEADSRIMRLIPGRFMHLCWCHPFTPWFRTLPPTLINSLWSNGDINLGQHWLR